MTWRVIDALHGAVREKDPILLVLAGPNGSGKSTFHELFVSPLCLPFVNADRIALALKPEKGNDYEAAKLADAERRLLLSGRQSFSMETVFSDPGGEKLRFLAEAQREGYTVILVFFGLTAADLSIARVTQRAAEGGHDVPDRKLVARFPRTLENLRKAVASLDFVFLFDNSSAVNPYRPVAVYRSGRREGAFSPVPAWAEDLGAQPVERPEDGAPEVLRLEAGATVDLVVLSVKEKTSRCRLLSSGEIVTFRASRLWELVPGEIATVKARKLWKYAGHPHLSGEIAGTRLEIATLELVPLRIENRGTWNPKEHSWGEKGQPIEAWAKPIIARGPRPEFEMEQVMPGHEVVDPFEDDPIVHSVDLKERGDFKGAERILMALCEADLRCLDAHAHLGNTAFDRHPEEAIRHFEVGFRIGDLSLGDRFEGLLPWGWLDNRPFLRCMSGYGLCLWRLGRFGEAGKVFEKMLWLNPSDNQGVRFLIGEVKARMPWKEDR